MPFGGKHRTQLTGIVSLLLAMSGLAFWWLNTSTRRARLHEELSVAVNNNDVVAAEHALRQGADPNMMFSSWEIMWNSLGAKAFVNPRDWSMRYHEIKHERFRSYPALLQAREPAMVQTLVAYGADLASTGGPTHRTALMTAAARGNPAKVKALLGAGASVRQRDKQGFTALLWAAAPLKYEVLPGAEGPYGKIIQMLLDAGADVNARLPDGTTALELAARSPHDKIVSTLKAAGGTR
jgi:hypothetical protein